MPVNSVGLLKRGDFAQYRSGTGRHVSIVDSNRVFFINNQIYYQILHAYGGSNGMGEYVFPDIPQAGDDQGRRVFARKVIRTWNNIGVDPYRFGRVIIWD